MRTHKLPCDVCKSTNYHFFRIRVNDVEEISRWCSECLNEATPNLSPDVYFDASKGSNQTDPNLCDRYKGPIPFSSKREKAAIMKQLGLRENGDKVHGARNFDRKASKQWDQ